MVERIRQKRIHCKQCNESTHHMQYGSEMFTGKEKMIHRLACVFTLGLYIPIYVIVSAYRMMQPNRFHCQVCGEGSGGLSLGGGLAIIALAILVPLGGIMAYATADARNSLDSSSTRYTTPQGPSVDLPQEVDTASVMPVEPSVDTLDATVATETEPAVLEPAPEPVEVAKEPGELRQWKSAKGSHSVMARLLSFDGDNVEIEKEDGVVKSIPLSKLSMNDRNYARMWSRD